MMMIMRKRRTTTTTMTMTMGLVTTVNAKFTVVGNDNVDDKNEDGDNVNFFFGGKRTGAGDGGGEREDTCKGSKTASSSLFCSKLIE